MNLAKLSVRWKIIGVTAVAAIAITGFYGRIVYEPVPEIPRDLKTELSSYLESYGKDPVIYIADKFDQHDIVFLGEAHRLRHDVEFVQRMVSALYQKGVTNLAIEFGSAELQAISDTLVTADNYDEAAVRDLMFEHKVYWGYVEYLGLYRAAWEVNRTRKINDKAFRIVHLDYSPKFSLVQEDMSDEIRSKVHYKGDRDRHMAEVLDKEVLANEEQALVYCGRNHSFTRFHQPVVDIKTNQVAWHHDRRFGNLVYEKIGNRAVTVLLHSAWSGSYPVGGVIDRVCLDMGNVPIGFDTQGTPFGDLPDSDTYYRLGYPEFNLGTICDGYVFLKPFVEFEGCRVDPEFVTSRNFKEAVDRFPTYFIRRFIRNKWLFDQVLNWDANPKHHHRNLTG